MFRIAAIGGRHRLDSLSCPEVSPAGVPPSALATGALTRPQAVMSYDGQLGERGIAHRRLQAAASEQQLDGSNIGPFSQQVCSQ